MKIDHKFGQKSTIHQNPGWPVFVYLIFVILLDSVSLSSFAIVFRYIKHAFTDIAKAKKRRWE